MDTNYMNQTCKVCGEPAAGFHFGAFTCEGCKSFFGRSYNNISSINDCKNNNKCIINKKNRTACKACRLRKCMLVGMSKSGSRYGRRSNWFKIHCLLQEQQQKQMQENGEDPNNQELLQPQINAPITTHQQMGMRLLGAGSFPPPLLHLPRTREELLLFGIDEPLRHSASPSVSSPESHNSDSSVEVPDARRLPLIPGLLPPTFLPPPGFLFPPPFYPGLLQPATPHHHNNNNNIISNNNNNNDKIFRTVANREVKREYLDAVLQLQRTTTPPEEQEDDDEDEEVDVKTIPTPNLSPVQDTPIDLSMRTLSERGSSPARSERSAMSMMTERGPGSEMDDESDCDSENRGMSRLSLARPTPLDLTTRV